MLEGLYSAASGMEAQQQQFNAISNDMANLDTPGYQSTVVGFHDLLYSNGAYGSTVPTGAGAAASIVGRDQSQGAIQTTDRPLDVAIQGPGYLQVRRNDGSIGLTRNGRLEVNARVEITNQDGNPLVPAAEQGTGRRQHQDRARRPGQPPEAHDRQDLALVNVPAPDQLSADGDSMFSVTAASGATRPATGSTIQQGALEGSNVDVAEDMTTMINRPAQLRRWPARRSSTRIRCSRSPTRSSHERDLQLIPPRAHLGLPAADRPGERAGGCPQRRHQGQERLPEASASRTCSCSS